MRPRLALALLILAGCADRGPLRGAPPAATPAAHLPPAPVTAGPGLALGVSHTCALAGGRVYCWGYGGHGQLGLGDRDDRPAPTLVPGLTDIVALTAGTWHTCALRAGGEVLCWGDGALGQLGDGTTGTRPRPAPVPGLRAIALVAGGTHTCAIDQARAVVCWGSNYRHEAGPGDDHLLRPAAYPGTPAADALAAGDSFTCALASGSVTCWGADPLREGSATDPAPVPELHDVLAIAAGHDHLCGLTGAGDIMCIGTGSKGQLGDGRPPALEPDRSPHGVARPRPRLATVAGITDAVQIALGGDFACARRRSGALACWGEGRDGQLGDGTRTRRDLPADLADLRDVVEFAAGRAHACARLAGGELRCWGYNEHGQAGPLDLAEQPTISSHPLTAARIAVGDAHACAFTDRDVWCWGDDTYGQLGVGETGTETGGADPTASRPRRDQPTRVTGLGRVVEVVTGARHTCSLAQDGTVMCWGDDTFGQLAGRGRPSGEPFDEHRGPLPLPPIATRSRAHPGLVAGLTDVIDLDVYEHHTCAVRRGGAITCWHAFTDDPLDPGPHIPGAVEIAVGAAHTCVRLDAGGVRCWGVNHTGRLGDGTTEQRTGPVAVRDLDDAIALVAGRLHTCALRSGGQVVCWGDGFMGQLGDGTRTGQPAPVRVAGLASARAIATARDTTCAIGQNGALHCWGDGDAGQLGAAGPGGRYAPVTVAPGPFRAAAVGARAVCAAGEDGLVSCWGDGLSAPAPRRWDVIATPRAIALN